MKIINKARLEEKGWTDKEIKHASHILERAELHDLFFSKIVFWSALLVIIFANLVVSLVLIPFLIAFNQIVLYSIVILLGLVIGFLYNFLITDIGYLEKKHHLLAGILLPVLALANMVIMVIISNKFISDLKIVVNEQHNPLLIAVVFAGAFILPYVADRLRLSLRKKKAV